MAKSYNTKQVFANLRVNSSEHGETLKQLLIEPMRQILIDIGPT